ncbi:DNA gyrase/topoisomerase IV subunit A [Aureispira anguillae]|uniref:DNA gyrase/topoisomerase IV subunit A n=1 Tax=Aureispira anguillae TaxID=2864201 RepID=A0A915YBA9_9BACT|nr:DNA gyrase/topoisomerase IV subunit A [Aureispira anguillae]BDS09923.1 DNA gyrase/topoisomerase IV subunit A [Aureispira anguillae]
MEENNKNLEDNLEENEIDAAKVIQVDVIEDMYKDYFLDYASYVILERAIPTSQDGLKPVQRRILHSMFLMNDGRFHKVANVIGQTMQFHPHGDAAIGDALVHIGQKDLMIDCQGNWGDVRTGDRAAAPRYIEARLSKFALDIAFNPKTTNFQFSYDGRKKEPIMLPMKFPLLLAQGVEGIAVGLSTKILPHNFVELIKASISLLKGKKVQIFPDFNTGGLADFSNYNGGKRGGKVRVRAKINILDKKRLTVTEIPYGTTTTGIIDSIIKANNKSKIKIKKVVDNTAADVEILIELPSGASPDVTMDALYAFTDCEVSISPNACTINGDTPVFTTVEELLQICTDQTQFLLEWELKNRKKELEDRWHQASLEKIFIEHKIYQDIEECESWEEVLAAVDNGLKPHIKHLMRAVIEEDLVRLTEIKIKRISKYNKFKADELLKAIEEELEEVKYHLAHIVEYTINYYSELLKKHGKGRERKTEITNFGTINAASVVINNAKLYINRKEGFIGYGSSLKKDEFISECSDIDNVIVFYKDGSYKVVKIADKVFVGKNPMHVAVWKKGDKRMTYNMIYADLDKGINYAKRFNVSAITREKQYPVATNITKSKVLHFSVNPNGEAETVAVLLTQSCSAKKKEFEYSFADLAVKGRSSRGNTITKYPIKKIKVTQQGTSTLGAIKVWYDDTTGRINSSAYGKYIGAFEEEDKIIALYQDGSYELTNYELTNRFDPKTLIALKKWDKDMVISSIHYDGERKATYVKRFKVETNSLNQKFNFLPNDYVSTKLLFGSLYPSPVVEYKVRAGRSKSIEGELTLTDFIDIKGWKSLGNKLSDSKLISVKPIHKEIELTEEMDDAKAKEKAANSNETADPQNTLF